MLFGAATRFLACAFVILSLSYVMPGFSAGGFSGAIPTALGAAAAGYVVEKSLKRPPSAKVRAVVGFSTCAAATYLAQFAVPGMAVSPEGAVIAGAAVGFIDFLVPLEAR